LLPIQGDKFEWPGFGLWKIPATRRFDYGLLLARFFNEVHDGFLGMARKT
jgi:hypothetical protein